MRTRKPRVGLTRLGRYLSGRWGRVTALAAVGVASGRGAGRARCSWSRTRSTRGCSPTTRAACARRRRVPRDQRGSPGCFRPRSCAGSRPSARASCSACGDDLFDHLTTLSLRYFAQQKAGWIIARLTSDVDALSDVLSQGLTTLVVNTLTLLAAIVGLFILDWRLGLVALVILPPTLILTRWFQVQLPRRLPARARDDLRR